MSRDGRESIFIFQLALAIFFFIQGIVGIINMIGVDIVSFSVVFHIVLSVLILISGVVLLAGCFNIGRADTIRIFTFFIMIIWGIQIFSVYFLEGIKISEGIMKTSPILIEWLPGLCKDIIILGSIGLVAKKYSRN